MALNLSPLSPQGIDITGMYPTSNFEYAYILSYLYHELLIKIN